MSRDIASMGYRPCVGVTLFNPAGLVFIGRRKPERGNGARASQQPVHEWQMPQGGIDPGEDPYNAALRELFEETNVRTTRLLAEAPDWYRYDLPRDVLGRGLRGRYRGQSQKWFALRFLGEENEIDVRAPGGGAHKPEFVDWRWEKLENLPGLIVPFKRPVYERVVEAFAHLGG